MFYLFKKKSKRIWAKQRCGTRNGEETREGKTFLQLALSHIGGGVETQVKEVNSQAGLLKQVAVKNWA